MPRDTTPSHGIRRAPTPAMRDSGGISAALQLSPVPSFMVDESGVVLACNELFADATSLPTALLVGREWWQAFAARSADDARTVQRSVAANAQSLGTSTVALHTAAGEPAWLDVSWRRLTEPQTRRLVWIFAITRWRRSASDDARSPGLSPQEASGAEIAALAALEVLDSTDVLESALRAGVPSGADGEKLTHQLQVLRATVRGLQRFASEASGGPRTVGASDLVQAALESLPADLRSHVVSVTDQSSATATFNGADPTRTMVHVLRNALRHLPPGEPVTVRAYDAPGFVCIEVRDRGPGLRPEALASANGPVFAREGAVGAAGLATARGLARALGGSLRVANDPEGGAAVTLSLPASGLRPSRGSLDRRSVLIVDDDPTFGRALLRLLQLHGARVTLARSLTDATESLAQEPYDAVVSDVDLPDGNGLSLLDSVASAHPGVHRVAMSGAERTGSAPSAGLLLRKPFDPAILVSALEQAFGAPR